MCYFYLSIEYFQTHAMPLPIWMTQERINVDVFMSNARLISVVVVIGNRVESIDYKIYEIQYQFKEEEENIER